MSNKESLRDDTCAEANDIVPDSLDYDPGMEVSTITKIANLPRRVQIIALRMSEDYHWEHAPYDPTLAGVITGLRAICYNALPEHVHAACRRDPAGRGNSEYYSIPY